MIPYNGQYFVFPDQSRIRRTGNETLKQAIDARYTTAATTPATGSNAVHIGNRTQSEPSTPKNSDIPSSAFISESYFLQCTPIAENHAIIVRVEDEEDSQAPTDVLAITRSKMKAAETEQASTSAQPLPQTPIPNVHPESKKAQPSYTYESKATNANSTKRILQNVLDLVVPSITVSDLLTISPELRKEAVDHCRTQRVPIPSTNLSTNVSVPTVQRETPVQIEHATPLREIHVTLNGVHPELGLLDEGSEIVVIQEDIWRKTNTPRNQ